MAPIKKMLINRAMIYLLLNKKLVLNKKMHSKRRYTKKKYWVKTVLLNRPYFDLENNLLIELLSTKGDLQNFTRLPFAKFLGLHEKVAPLITKQETHMRSPISSKLRLAVTLRYLASGNSYKSLEFLSRISRITIGNFVPEVCGAIITVLKDTYLKVPSTEEEQKISFEFEKKWHFPHTIGALDGKHVSIQVPPNEGSYYFNYKGFHSIVLLALVDANYNFIYIDCGGNGRISNGGIYKNSSLYKAINVNNQLKLPAPKPLPCRNKNVPYYIIGDDAFALTHNLMKPYLRSANLSAKQKKFNYRLCRARRVVENAFGILCSRFRIFTRPMDTNLKTTESVIICCCALHNFLRPESFISVENKASYDILPNIQHEGTNFSTNLARQTRDEFSSYFVNEGDTYFQWMRI